MSKQQSLYIGLGLLILGVVAILNLWWLIPAVLLVAGGLWFYRTRRMQNRLPDAVQGALWGVGLGLLYLIGGLFWLPGLLMLAGASFLLRGREHEVDARLQPLMQTLTSMVKGLRPQRSSAPAQKLTVEQVSSVQTSNRDLPVSGETRRL